jgi:hypothetical protein
MLFLSWYFWVVPHILVGVCLIGLLRRPRARQLPVFRCFLIVQVVGFLCLFMAALLILRFPAVESWYERIDIADVAASELVTLGVIYELTDELVFSRLSLRHAVLSLMRWTLVALLLASSAASALLQNGGLQNTRKIFQVVDCSGSVMTIGLLLAVLLFTRVLHVSWRSLPAGIIFGFWHLCQSRVICGDFVFGIRTRENLSAA